MKEKKKFEFREIVSEFFNQPESIFVILVSMFALAFVILILTGVHLYKYDQKYGTTCESVDFDIYKMNDYSDTYLIEVDNRFFTVSEGKITVGNENKIIYRVIDSGNPIRDANNVTGSAKRNGNCYIETLCITTDTAKTIGLLGNF